MLRRIGKFYFALPVLWMNPAFAFTTPAVFKSSNSAQYIKQVFNDMYQLKRLGSVTTYPENAV